MVLCANISITMIVKRKKKKTLCNQSEGRSLYLGNRENRYKGNIHKIVDRIIHIQFSQYHNKGLLCLMLSFVFFLCIRELKRFDEKGYPFCCLIIQMNSLYSVWTDWLAWVWFFFWMSLLCAMRSIHPFFKGNDIDDLDTFFVCLHDSRLCHIQHVLKRIFLSEF